MEMVNGNNGIIGSRTESKYYVWILSTIGSRTESKYNVWILSTINRGLFKPSVSSAALHHHSNVLVDMLPPEVDSSISELGLTEKSNML
jgi:26S proteasome regulatory subunit T3